MTESFAEFCRATDADRETLQVAARYYIAELTDYRTAPEMLDQMSAATASPDTQIASVVMDLESRPDVIEAAARAILAAAWEVPGETDRVRRAVQAARSKMPVVEVGLLALVSVYGMYLLATGGISKQTITTRQNENGETSTVVETEYHSVAEPLKAITGLFSKQS